MHVNSVSDAPCHCSLPIGNLGNDENFALYDIGLTRLLQKNRALTWASNFSGRPDLGSLFFPSTNGVSKPLHGDLGKEEYIEPGGSNLLVHIFAPSSWDSDALVWT